jgi:two-component system sensor histidine kinase ChiS
MQVKLREFNGDRIRAGQPIIAAGVGINTGSLMLGTIGHSGRMQSTVISDAVNVAARLEALSKVFKAAIIASSETFRRVSDTNLFQGRCLGKVRVKGKTQPVAIYEIFDGYSPEVVELRLKTKADFEKGIEAWQKLDIAECERFMRKVMEVNPNDQAAVLYVHRCKTSQLAAASQVDSELEMEMGMLV